ncbi:MAG: hypothetical protein LBQ42_08815 [Synergistaceae bacterium]|nr:hypothetical protein [Synergistaceae bacterium]
MHAYSELYAEMHGAPKHQLVHELSMLVLGKQIDGSEDVAAIYARYRELRSMFSNTIDD